MTTTERENAWADDAECGGKWRGLFFASRTDAKARRNQFIFYLRVSAAPRKNDVWLNRQIIGAGSAGVGVAHALADGGEFGGEVVFDEEHIGAVDEEVGAHLEEPGLLLGVAPEMDAGSAARGAGLIEDGLYGREEFRRVVLLGYAEVAGQIVRTDEQGIDLGRGEQIIQRIDGRLAFNCLLYTSDAADE